MYRSPVDFIPGEIDGSWIVHSPIHEDERGLFREWFKSNEVKTKIGLDFKIEQANFSESIKGVVRGVHYSLEPSGQAKWITCTFGSIRDYVIDIRPGSSTYGKWQAIDLSAGSSSSVLIGRNLGHAFITLSDRASVAYLVSSPFSPESEYSINPLDKDLAIDWGVDSREIILSTRDRHAPKLLERFETGKLPKL